MRELLLCIKHTQNPKTSRLVCYRCSLHYVLWVTACRLHRDTEHLEVSSLYPLHPTLTHSAWGRQSRHQGFNYGCQATPPEQVLRFDSNPKPSVRTRFVSGQETPGASRHSHVCDIRCVLLQHHRVPLKAIVKVCPHSGNRSSEWRG